MTKVSFVIANYNYEKYVAQTIDSALASDWPDIEIIVVDDGSKDNSKAVIDGYGDKVKAVYQENGGQASANNNGFFHSTGDLIVFLDADDLIDPTFAREVATAWRPGVSKVQVQMQKIDAHDVPFDGPFPPWEVIPTPEMIRKWVLSTSEYPTPPGTGNAYARSFLAKFFPVKAEDDSFTDSTTLPLAPMLGDVVSIRKPLALYRRHGNNDSNLSAGDGLFAREVARAIKRQASADRICKEIGIEPPKPGIVRYSWYVLQLRAGSLRLRPETHPIPEDSRVRIGMDAVTNIFRDSYQPMKKRLMIAVWVLVVLAAPKNLARKLMLSRFGG